MVLGKLSELGRSAGSGSGGTKAYCACGECGWGLFGRFCSRLPFLFFLPLWETARYRLKYCLKGCYSQNNQPNVASNLDLYLAFFS